MSSFILALPYLVAVFAVGTLLALFAGLVTMVSSTPLHDKYGNVLMRWRVGLQSVTLSLMVLLVVLQNIFD